MDGGGGDGLCKAAEGKGTDKGKGDEGGEGGKGKGKGKGKSTGHCSNCDIFGPVRRCTQCGVEAYCGETCQRVSE